MTAFRTLLFWCHLVAGLAAGAVILIMSVTGVALTYERQLNEWTLGHLRSQPPDAHTGPLSTEAILTRLQQDHPGVVPTGITRGQRRDAPVVVLGEPQPLYVDAYTARVIGERGESRLRTLLADLRSWHRWLAAEGDSRATARAITGWSNLLFLFLVVSGLYLWLPRFWTWVQFRSVLLFRRRYGTSKARDFNWHHVLGFWSAIPLAIVVASAVPISFPWASDLVYRLAGDVPPARAAAPGRAAAPPPRTRVSVDGLDGLWARAAADQPEWRTITARFPLRPHEPIQFTIDRGDGGQPQLRSTLSLDRSGRVVARETFADQSSGRRLRSIMRFAHTGEVLGLAGQTVAGLVSAVGVVMVWTGLALSWRRFRAWVARRSQRSDAERARAA